MDMVIMGLDLADVLIGVLVGHGIVSEGLGFLQKIKANNTSQLIFNILKAAVGLFGSKNKSNNS